jgi:hypothetical protein
LDNRSPFTLEPTGALVLAVLLAVAWIAVSWQVLRLGVYVSKQGALIHGLVMRYALSWDDVQRISVEHATYRLFGAEIPAGKTVVIDLRDGSRVNTPLWAHGIDFHFRPGVFQEVQDELRRCHVAATTQMELRTDK